MKQLCKYVHWQTGIGVYMQNSMVQWPGQWSKSLKPANQMGVQTQQGPIVSVVKKLHFDWYWLTPGKGIKSDLKQAQGIITIIRALVS